MVVWLSLMPCTYVTAASVVMNTPSAPTRLTLAFYGADQQGFCWRKCLRLGTAANHA
jgi:hypothetical protein